MKSTRRVRTVNLLLAFGLAWVPPRIAAEPPSSQPTLPDATSTATGTTRAPVNVAATTPFTGGPTPAPAALEPKDFASSGKRPADRDGKSDRFGEQRRFLLLLYLLRLHDGPRR